MKPISIIIGIGIIIVIMIFFFLYFKDKDEEEYRNSSYGIHLSYTEIFLLILLACAIVTLIVFNVLGIG